VQRVGRGLDPRHQVRQPVLFDDHADAKDERALGLGHRLDGRAERFDFGRARRHDATAGSRLRHGWHLPLSPQVVAWR
jgi:hypothetical protein